VLHEALDRLGLIDCTVGRLLYLNSAWTLLVGSVKEGYSVCGKSHTSNANSAVVIQNLLLLQGSDTVGWATGRASGQ